MVDRKLVTVNKLTQWRWSLASWWKPLHLQYNERVVCDDTAYFPATLQGSHGLSSDLLAHQSCLLWTGGHTSDDEEHSHGQVRIHGELGVEPGLDGGEDEPLFHGITGVSRPLSGWTAVPGIGSPEGGRRGAGFVRDPSQFKVCGIEPKLPQYTCLHPWARCLAPFCALMYDEIN